MSQRISFTCAIAVALASCSNLRAPDVPAGASTRRPVELPPVIPVSQWTAPLFLSPIFVVFYARSPTNPSYFRVYGADLWNWTLVYQLEGFTPQELSSFLGRVGSEMAQANNNWMVVGDIPGPMPWGVGPTGECIDFLLNTAYDLWARLQVSHYAYPCQPPYLPDCTLP